MKTDRKRFVKQKSRCVWLSLLGILTALILSGCGNTADSDVVTRGEWITMLATAFGMDSYQETSPYYADVSETSEIFLYVQSAHEWGVLAVFDGDTFDADKELTRREMASTAAIAASYSIVADQGDSAGDFNPDASVEFALQNGILDSKKRLSQVATLEECDAAVEAACNAYMDIYAEERAIAVLNEELIDFTGLDPSLLHVEGSTVTIPARADMVEVGVGDVFVTAPTEEEPAGVAYKVTAIEEVDGTLVLTTEEPELCDLYEELDIYQTVTADASDILWLVDAERVEAENEELVADVGDTYQISLMSTGSEPYTATSMTTGSGTYTATPITTGSLSLNQISKDFTFSSGDFSLNWSNNSSDIIGAGEGAEALRNSGFVYNDTPSIADFGGSTSPWQKQLQVDNSFFGGYRITGNITYNAIRVTVAIDYKRNEWTSIPYGINSASIKIDSDITAALTLEGTLNERLHIATVPIAIGSTGLSVNVELYLYVDASGKLTVSAALENYSKTEYQNGMSKRVAVTEVGANVDANMEIDFGADLSALMKAFGVVKVADVGVRAGGLVEASAHVGGTCTAINSKEWRYEESLSIQADLYAPIVSIYSGNADTLLSKVGVTGTWNIKTKANTNRYNLASYEWVIWEETVEEEMEPEESDNGEDPSEETPETEQNFGQEDGQSVLTAQNFYAADGTPLLTMRYYYDEDGYFSYLEADSYDQDTSKWLLDCDEVTDTFRGNVHSYVTEYSWWISDVNVFDMKNIYSGGTFTYIRQLWIPPQSESSGYGQYSMYGIIGDASLTYPFYATSLSRQVELWMIDYACDMKTFMVQEYDSAGNNVVKITTYNGEGTDQTDTENLVLVGTCELEWATIQ